MPDLKDVLEQAIDHMPAAADVDPGPDLMRGRNLLRRRRRTRAASATAACVAAAVVLVVAVTGGGTGAQQRHATAAGGRDAKHTSTVTVTAAMVRRLAAASKSALAYSGRALVSYTDSGQAVQPSYGTEAITFSGSSWNDVLTEYLVHPDAGVRNPQHAINRIVDGKVYYYFTRTSGGYWVHDTNPDAVHAVDIPDPRTLLSVLQPDARFTVAGHQVSGGIRLEQLRATRLDDLTGFVNSLTWALPGEHLSGLSLWVDRSGVVHRIAINLSGTEVTYPFYQSVATTLTVTFSGIGQPQVITAPSSFTDTYGLG
jgi:hypothetical protein